MDHQQDGSNTWMWTQTTTNKRKLESYESWEERAFAEDAAGVLGSSGCVWPPRSYTCSFCRREFKSAQALGGHMNVHRRDRARLKQLPNTPQDQQQPLISPLSSSSPFLKVDPNYKKCPSPNLTTFVYGTRNPNPNYNPLALSNGVANMQVCNFSSSPSSTTNFYPNFGERGSKNEGNEVKCANSELSISLNLVVRRNCLEEEESSCVKRRKMIVASSPEGSQPLIFVSKSGEVDHKSKINVGLRDCCSSSSREIDLELRLGG